MKHIYFHYIVDNRVQHSSRFSSVDDYFCLLGLLVFKGIFQCCTFIKNWGNRRRHIFKEVVKIDAAEAQISWPLVPMCRAPEAPDATLTITQPILRVSRDDSRDIKESCRLDKAPMKTLHSCFHRFSGPSCETSKNSHRAETGTVKFILPFSWNIWLLKLCGLVTITNNKHKGSYRTTVAVTTALWASPGLLSPFSGLDVTRPELCTAVILSKPENDGRVRWPTNTDSEPVCTIAGPPLRRTELSLIH